jgi:hypothetical protein
MTGKIRRNAATPMISESRFDERIVEPGPEATPRGRPGA